MTIKLFIQAITKIFFGMALIGLMIFVPAGTLSFFNGWLFMGILFVPMFFAGIVMMFRNPELLKKRLNAKEKQSKQKLVVILSGIMFLAGFIVAGLGVRFQWYSLPKGVVFGAVAVFLLAYLLYAEVIRENAYLSRIIEVQEGQKVIDTGSSAFLFETFDGKGTSQEECSVWTGSVGGGRCSIAYCYSIWLLPVQQQLFFGFHHADIR